jgi:hypothetical protein
MSSISAILLEILTKDFDFCNSPKIAGRRRRSGWLITSACGGAGNKHYFRTMPKSNSMGKFNERAFRKAIDKNFTLDFCLHDGNRGDALAKALAKAAGKSKVRRRARTLMGLTSKM